MFFILEHNNFRYLNEEIFYNFLNANETNTLHLKENPLNCGPQHKHLYDWILNQNQFKSRVFGAECSDGTPIWDFDWTSKGTSKPILWCNENGEYNGSYGIDKWPEVPSGQYSVINCPKGRGKMQWLCKEDESFHEDGPEMDECWINELLDKNITSVEDVKETLEEIIVNTGNSSSLNSLKSLQKMVKLSQN